MTLGLDPENLPIVGAQLVAMNAEAMANLGSIALSCIPEPPAADSISMMFTPALTASSTDLFGMTVPGMGHHAAAGETLPAVDAAYFGCDTTKGAEIASHCAAFGD